MVTLPMLKISIITVVFNSVNTIEPCINSVLNQTYPLEHIIIDGGSTDGTLDVINQYSTDNLKLISEPDEGMYDALNKGIDAASGDIIGILHADDIFENNEVISKVARVFEIKNPDTCYGDLLYVDHNDTNKIIRYWQSGSFKKNKFLWGWMPPHPTFFVKKMVYKKFGGFNLSLGSAADYELMLRLLVKNKCSCAYLPKIITRMRVGGVSNASLKNRLKANINDRKAWEVNNIRPYPWTLYFKPLRKIKQYFIKPSTNTLKK